MAKGMTQQDIFMQFAHMEVASNATASTTLAESEETTGLSIRGGFAWAIHELVWFLQATYDETIASCLKAALSTQQGDSDVPGIAEGGTIGVFQYKVTGAVALAPRVFPWFQKTTPPIVIASPKLSLYVDNTVDAAGLRNKKINCRIGYTTVPMTQELYLEIAETWRTI